MFSKRTGENAVDERDGEIPSIVPLLRTGSKRSRTSRSYLGISTVVTLCLAIVMQAGVFVFSLVENALEQAQEETEVQTSHLRSQIEKRILEIDRHLSRFGELPSEFNLTHWSEIADQLPLRGTGMHTQGFITAVSNSEAPQLVRRIRSEKTAYPDEIYRSFQIRPALTVGDAFVLTSQQSETGSVNLQPGDDLGAQEQARKLLERTRDTSGSGLVRAFPPFGNSQQLLFLRAHYFGEVSELSLTEKRELLRGFSWIVIDVAKIVPEANFRKVMTLPGLLEFQIFESSRPDMLARVEKIAGHFPVAGPEIHSSIDFQAAKAEFRLVLQRPFAVVMHSLDMKLVYSTLLVTSLILVVLLFVTGRVRAERGTSERVVQELTLSLQTIQEHLHILSDASPVGLCLVDESGVIAYANREFGRIVDLDTQRIQGIQFSILFAETETGDIELLFQSGSRTSKHGTILRTRQGADVPADLHVVPYRGKTEQTLYIITVVPLMPLATKAFPGDSRVRSDPKLERV